MRHRPQPARDAAELDRHRGDVLGGHGVLGRALHALVHPIYGTGTARAPTATAATSGLGVLGQALHALVHPIHGYRYRESAGRHRGNLLRGHGVLGQALHALVHPIHGYRYRESTDRHRYRPPEPVLGAAEGDFTVPHSVSYQGETVGAGMPSCSPPIVDPGSVKPSSPGST